MRYFLSEGLSAGLGVAGDPVSEIRHLVEASLIVRELLAHVLYSLDPNDNIPYIAGDEPVVEFGELLKLVLELRVEGLLVDMDSGPPTSPRLRLCSISSIIAAKVLGKGHEHAGHILELDQGYRKLKKVWEVQCRVWPVQFPGYSFDISADVIKPCPSVVKEVSPR